MTSKEAAYILKNTAFLDGKSGHEKTEEAIKMAISALTGKGKYDDTEQKEA